MSRSRSVAALCVALAAAGAAVARGETCKPCAGNAVVAELKAEPGLGQVRLIVEVSGLKLSAEYVLCLNGVVGQAGNDRLIKTPGWQSTGGAAFRDLDTVTTDATGRLTYRGEVRLPPGRYDLTFLIKDKGNAHCAIYCRDHLRFVAGREDRGGCGCAAGRGGE